MIDDELTVRKSELVERFGTWSLSILLQVLAVAGNLLHCVLAEFCG
jgi:hypothetical protein